jgi:serine/threonine protein phosphatase PrpC
MATFATDTHPGRVYEHNEDTLGCLPERGFFLVADGMGGHASGEVASRIVADTLLATVDRTPLDEALLEAHRAVVAAGEQDPARKGMGSTAVALKLGGGRAQVAWVGDSRGYLWRRGRLTRLTRDHSLLNVLLDRGEVTEADLATHPNRHVVTQTLGHHVPVPSETEARVRRGDRLLLCSDGLHDELSDREIEAVLRGRPPLDLAVRTLIEQALARGGRDNVSVVLVECGVEDAAPWYGRFEGIPRRWWPLVVGVGAALLVAALLMALRQADLI